MAQIWSPYCCVHYVHGEFRKTFARSSKLLLLFYVQLKKKVLRPSRVGMNKFILYTSSLGLSSTGPLNERFKILLRFALALVTGSFLVDYNNFKKP